MVPENRLAQIAVLILGYSILGGFMLGAAALAYEVLKYCFGWTRTLPYLLIVSGICFTYLAMDKTLDRSERITVTLQLSIVIVIGAVLLTELFSGNPQDSDEGFTSVYRNFTMPFWAAIFICYLFFNFNEADRRMALEDSQKKK